MKQIIQSYKSGELWLAEVPIPACRAGGVRVCTQASFVSAGTERMLVDFARKNLVGKALAMPDQVKKVIRKVKAEGFFSTLEKVQAKLDQPIPLGYSCAGVIEEVGCDVTGLYVGDRVACGGAGYANHAECNYVPKNLMVRIPDGVSWEDASCATVGSIALQGIRQCDVRLGETVCVMGLGLLGLLAVQMLKAAGCRVLGYDPNQSRAQMALDLGADRVATGQLAAAAEELTLGYGVDAVLITAATSSNEPVTLAGEIARHRGKVVVTGMVGMDLPRDAYYKKELDFKLSLSYGPGRYDPGYEEAGRDYPYGYVRWTEQRNMQAFLQMVAEQKVTPGRLITHRYDIDEALEAYELLLGKKDEPYLGIVIQYPERTSQSNVLEIATTTEQHETDVKDRPLGIGWIGAGNFAKAVLLPEVKKRESMQCVGVCTSSGMNAGETARKEQMSLATTDAQSLIQDERVEVVFVSTPHQSHAGLAKSVLQAGKHVFVEKPLAINRDQLNELLEVWNQAAASSQGTPVLMVGFNRRFSPHVALIKDYFANRNTPMVIHYRINAGMIPRDHWIQDPEVGGGRIVGEVCHFVDTASYLVGAPVTRVQAMSVATDNHQEVAEDSLAVQLHHADGSLTNLCYVAYGASDYPKERCEVFASESVAVLEDYKHTRCQGRLGKRKLAGKQQKGFAQEIEALEQGVRSGDLPISIESLINTTLTTFAIQESLRTGTMVSIDSCAATV